MRLQWQRDKKKRKKRKRNEREHERLTENSKNLINYTLPYREGKKKSKGFSMRQRDLTEKDFPQGAIALFVYGILELTQILTQNPFSDTIPV